MAEWDESKRPVVVLQGQLSTAEDQIRLELTIRKSQATVLTLVSYYSKEKFGYWKQMRYWLLESSKNVSRVMILK